MNTYEIRIQHRMLNMKFYFDAISRADADDVCNSLDVLLNPHDIPGKMPVRVELVMPHDIEHAMMRHADMAARLCPEMPFLLTINNEREGFYSDEKKAIEVAKRYESGDVIVWKEYPADMVNGIIGPTLDIDGRFFKHHWYGSIRPSSGPEAVTPRVRPEMPTATAVEPIAEPFEPFVMKNLNNLSGAIDKLQNRLDQLTKDYEQLRAAAADKIEAIGGWCNNLEHAANEDRTARSGFARTTRDIVGNLEKRVDTLTNRLDHMAKDHEQLRVRADAIFSIINDHNETFVELRTRLENLESAVSASREPRSTLRNQLREMLNTIERNG